MIGEPARAPEFDRRTQETWAQRWYRHTGYLPDGSDAARKLAISHRQHRRLDRVLQEGVIVRTITD